MEVSKKLLKTMIKHLIVYDQSETTIKWVWNDDGNLSKKKEIDKTYYLSYGDCECEISLEEYMEFLELEKTLKVR